MNRPQPAEPLQAIGNGFQVEDPDAAPARRHLIRTSWSGIGVIAGFERKIMLERQREGHRCGQSRRQIQWVRVNCAG
jgi:hypothetical protein